jgi:tol-pal system protein YbgF
VTNRWSRPGARLLVSLSLATVLASGGATAAGGASQVPGSLKLDALESAAGELGAQFNALAAEMGGILSVPQAKVERFEFAQRSRNAQTAVRLDQLEEQMRLLTGQIEGLQFQMTQMQALLARMQEDFEFRFSELEGGGLGKTEAAPRSDSGSLSGVAPPATPSGTEVTPVPGLDPNLASTVQPLGTLSSGALSPGGELSGGLNVDIEGPAFDGTGALDLDLNPGNIVTNADAEAAYQAGFNALQRGDFEFAEQQFTQFLSLYPTHVLAPDASNWLGEVLLSRGAYEEAAAVLVNSFEKYPNATRSPDILLKLGVALARAGERETACRTYVEVLRRFPGQPGAFMARVSEEQRTAQC